MKKLLFWLCAIVTLIISLAYLASCFTPYVNPVYFSELALLALGFPYLAIGVVSLMLLWLLIRKKVSLILLVVLLAGYENITATLGFNFMPAKPSAKAPHSLRIMGWNVRQFENPAVYIDTPGSRRRLMFDYIKSSGADVVCFQEFGEYYIKTLLSNTIEMLDIGYQYYYRTDETFYKYPYGHVLSGTAIFSKVPLLDAGKDLLGDSTNPEHIAHVDVMLDDKPVRIYATHFKSLNLYITMEDPHNRVFLYGDSTFIYRASKIDKIKKFGQAHAKEALIAKDVMNNSTVPFVFCGDLNSVPTSYAYHTMRRGLQDAFLQNGYGLGTTMDSLRKTLRIDYLLVHPKLAITNYRKDTLHLSDHFPQMIDVSWKD